MESDVIKFARSVLHGDQAHRDWLLNKAKEFSMETEIETLKKKAAKSADSNDAVRFSQAALNLAHVATTLATARSISKTL